MASEGAAKAERPRVSAVIATWNRREAVEIVLDRLAELPVDEVLVVDNGSEDGTAELVRSRGGNVRLLEQGANLGLAGRNRAVREASGELLLMLDDDAYPLPGAIETLAERFARDPQLAVAGGFVRDVDLAGCVVRSIEIGTFDWWLRAGRTGQVPPEGIPAFFFPEGASMLRRSAFLEVGGYFEPYFHLVEGIDLATRLLAAGWDVRYVPEAQFDHMKAQTARSSDRALYLRIRNNLWYLWLHFPASVAFGRSVGYLLYDLIDASYQRHPGAWARAIRDAWTKRDLVRGERRPLPREIRRRAELNRGRTHVRLLAGQLRRRLPGSR
jgi:N-acetylglucosaminyl-diphospho-decaprenol L-rhamnosyltransferase